MNNLDQTLEALLFIADGPLSLDRLSTLLEAPRSELRPVLERLEQHYNQPNRGIHLASVAGGYQFRTPPELAPCLRQLQRVRSPLLSRAALEALAIIAYRQPVTRAEVEYLRGVDSGGVVKTLLDRNLLRILGKKEIAGRPLMYGTSKYFLELFGLHSLDDLPTLKEFSALDPELTEAEPLSPDPPNHD